MEINAPVERRAIARLPGNTLHHIRLDADGHETDAQIQDISIVGMGFLAPKPFEAGSWLLLKPLHNRMKLSPELKAEVRYTRTHGEQSYFMGCRFSRMLTADDMLALG